MLLVADVTDNHRARLDADSVTGLDKLKLVRSDIPAVTHVDYSARLQTVDRDRHGRFFTLLERWYARTGCPVLINTSFNVRGEPIVCTPDDAYRCFMATNMDALVLENFLVLKEGQDSASHYSLDEHLRQFQLD